MTKHCCQVCVLSMMFCRSDSRLCWPCWHGKWLCNRENLSTTWLDTPTGQRGKWYEKYSLSLIFTFYLNSDTWMIPCSVDQFQYWQHRNHLLKIVGDCGRAIQNDVDIDTYYCKRKLISWRWINKTVFYTRFLSPTDLKCAESSTYWQFFYYRPPGKFRWTSVPFRQTAGDIAKMWCLKHMSLSLYIYISLSIIDMDLLYR